MAYHGQLPPDIRRVLWSGGFAPEAPAARAIFTNRDLAFDTIPLVGFDMDYTLAIYRQDRLEALSIDKTVEKLVARGYPETLVHSPRDPEFAIRGLVVDRRLGNVLKMDRHGYVGRAYHGHHKLTREERRTIYRYQRLGRERERFTEVDTLFALPEVTLYADVVERIDHHAGEWGADGAPTYEEAWTDVRECIDEAHRDDSIKSVIKADPGHYFDRDPDLAPMLHKLRSSGKRLFLLTNSFFPYTNAVMTYLLGDALPSYADWQSYFDWTVVGSGKPGFFTQGRPFQEIDREGQPMGGPKAVPQRGRMYVGGNQIGLQESLGVHADEVLYVGDHIYGDIVKSKKSSGWRTALIVSELEGDVEVRRARSMTIDEIANLHTLRSRIAEEISAIRHLSRVLTKLSPTDLVDHGADPEHAASLLERTRVQVRQRFDRLRRYELETQDTLERRAQEIDEAFNPYWGSVFAERHDTSRFGSQVESFACIYTSRASNFQYVSPANYFHSPHGALPHWIRGRP